MRKRVALLHTSFALLGPERLLFSLFEELLPDVELINIVDDGMLREVMGSGRVTALVTRRMCHYVLAAEAMQVDAIFSTCSSLGPAVSVAKELVTVPVIKIDDAMAEVAGREGRRVAVLASVRTTLAPTVRLVQEKADAIGRTLELRPVLADGAFERLMAGDRAGHDAMISAKAREAAEWADTLVLAQCTMARLAPQLENETGIPVLSSPRRGVEHLKRVLETGQSRNHTSASSASC